MFQPGGIFPESWQQVEDGSTLQLVNEKSLYLALGASIEPFELWEGDNGISCCSVIRQGASQKLGMRKIPCFKLAAATLVVLRLVTGMNAGYIDILTHEVRGHF